jgi:DNA-binding CsgD family transcriptional regulator
VRTVERHTLNIYTKLGVRGRAEAVAVGYTHAGGPTEPA